LSDEAVWRIERQLRQALFAELAQLELGGIVVRSAAYRGVNGIEVTAD
jgi:hypothetical protein